MAKKHKNLKNIPIQWDGDLSKPSDGSAQSSPDSVDLGTWGAGWWSGDYVPDFDCPLQQTSNTEAQCYFEDYDINVDGSLNILDIMQWMLAGAPDELSNISTGYIRGVMDGIVDPDEGNPLPPKASETKFIDQSKIYSDWNGFIPDKGYTWGDVSFVIEIADGIGTGSRRAREARLHKFDKDTQKRLIHLICRVKGEKVYDEEKVVGDIQIKLEDADLVIKEVLGKMRVENTNVL